MELIYSLGLLANRASVALTQTVTNRLKKAGLELTHSQFVVLRALYYKDSQSQYELAKLLCKDAAAIKRTVDQLEEKDLARRRAVTMTKNAVAITGRGRAIIPQAIEIGDAVIEEALQGSDPAERDRLFELLNNIYINLEK